MRQTLFYIPAKIGELPVFGFGWLLILWAIGSVALVAWLVRRQGWTNDTRAYLPVLGLIGAAIAFLLPAIVEEDGLPIRGYGTMVLLGVASGVGLAAVRAKRAGLNPELIFSLAFWMFLAGMFGARLFYVIEYWKTQFHRETIGETLGAIANIAQGGLVVFGAFIGGTLAFMFFAVRNRLPFLATFDLIAPSMLLGLALGRIGCFLNGCCFGGECSHPWAVQFPYGSPPFSRQAEEGKLDLQGLIVGIGPESTPVIKKVLPRSPAATSGLKEGELIVAVGHHRPGDKRPVMVTPVFTTAKAQQALLQANEAGMLAVVETKAEGVRARRTWVVPDPLPRSRPVHPTQLYSAIDAALLCAFLLAWYPYRQRDGELLAWMLVLHGMSRFVLEAIRTDERKEFILGMSISQNISVVMFLVGIGLWVYLLGQPRRLTFYATEKN